MSNPQTIIKQADLTRYLKAWRATYSTEPKIEIRLDGTILICPASAADISEPSDWD